MYPSSFIIRRTVVGFLLALYVSSSSASLRFSCNHDTLLHTGRIPTAIPSFQNYSDTMPLPPTSSSPATSPSSASSLRYRSLVSASPSVADQIRAFTNLTATYKPLRIKSLFVDVSATATGMTLAKKNFLLDTLIPAVTSSWSSLLAVNPIVGPWYASRQCTAIYTDTGRCASYATETQCGYSTGASNDDVKIVIANDYFRNQTYYSSPNNPVMLPAGNGIPSTDFVMYVTAKHTADCPNAGESGTLAYALTCQRDQYDRPIMGRVNFCPYALSTDTADWNISFAVGMHEYAHALGFSSSSWPLFRNWDSLHSPKTPRNPVYPDSVDDKYLTSSYSCGGNTYDQEPFPDPSTTVDYFAERGMTKCTIEQAGSGSSNCVAKHVGYRVLAAARQFFDCPTLNGVELENHLTTSCSLQGSHWEQRIFNPELMTSYIQPQPLLSAVTLALFEESGWYKANYTRADGWRKGLDWGYKQGCDFVLKPCIDKATGTGTGSPPHFYTTQPARICTLNRAAVGTVLMASGQSVPSQYRYFTTDPTKGGDSNIDYCPVVEAYSNTHCTDLSSPSATDVSNGRYYGESYGPQRACFETTLRMNGVVSGPTGAGCLKYECRNTTENGVHIVLTAINSNSVEQSLICTTGDKGIKKSMVSGYTGQITCPDIAPLCGTPEILVPIFTPDDTWSTSTDNGITDTDVPATVQATLVIAGLTVNNVQGLSNPSQFTDTLVNGLANVLNVSTIDVQIIRLYASTSRRLSTDSLFTGWRRLAAGDLAIDFTVTTTSTASNALTTTITNAFGGGSNAAMYTNVVNSMLGNIATVTGVAANSLTASVNPSSIVTVLPSTTITTVGTDTLADGAIIGIIVGCIVVLTVGGLLYVWIMKRQAAKIAILTTGEENGGRISKGYM